jgi:hypothetical protein
MNGIDATRETIGLVHDYLEAAIDGCEPETLAHVFPGATIGAILPIYIHAVDSEDWCFQQLIQKKPKLIESGKWYERWGVAPPQPGKEVDWNNVTVPLSEVRDYAKAVYAATDEWLNGATEADLDLQVDWHSGPKSAAWVIADTVHVHLSFHAGEISSLKGVMGLKGLPW